MSIKGQMGQSWVMEIAVDYRKEICTGDMCGNARGVLGHSANRCLCRTAL